MTFQTDLAAAAHALGVIAVNGTAALTEPEFDTALYARATLVDLAIAVHTDLTGLRHGVKRPTAGDLETHPVAAFVGALRDHPRVEARSAPSDVLSATPVSVPGQAWKAAARHALAAHHAWATGTLDRPTSEAAAWSGIADLAAVAAVLAELDEELARAGAAIPGRQFDGERLARGAGSGLRTAAREAAALAASGPLAPTGPEPRPGPRRTIVRVREPQDAVEAQEQLVVLLRAAHHMRPERVALIALGHQRTCQALATVWLTNPTHVRPDLRSALHRHIDLLGTATARRSIAASIDGGDPFPLHQANVLRQALHPDRAALIDLARGPDLSGRFVAALADTTSALAEVSDRHLRAGAWLLPRRDGVALNWVTSDSWHGVPATYQALRAAAVHAEHLTASIDPATEVFRRIVGRPAPGTAVTNQPGRTPTEAASPVPAARHRLAPAPFRPIRGATTPLRPPQPATPPRSVAPPPTKRGMRR